MIGAGEQPLPRIPVMRTRCPKNVQMRGGWRALRFAIVVLEPGARGIQMLALQKPVPAHRFALSRRPVQMSGKMSSL